MRVFLYAGMTLTLLSVGASADEKPGKQQSPSFTGTAVEVGPSPYAEQGGLGRILIADAKDRMIFHILKDTKIIKIVDGKPQPAKFADVKKGDTLKAVYDSEVAQSDPAQASTISLEIIKTAE